MRIWLLIPAMLSALCGGFGFGDGHSEALKEASSVCAASVREVGEYCVKCIHELGEERGFK